MRSFSAVLSHRFIPLSGFFYFFRSAAADLRTFAASAGLEALGQQWNQQKMVIWCQTGSVTQLMHASVKLCVGGSAPTGEQWHAGTTISFWTLLTVWLKRLISFIPIF